MGLTMGVTGTQGMHIRPRHLLPHLVCSGVRVCFTLKFVFLVRQITVRYLSFFIRKEMFGKSYFYACNSKVLECRLLSELICGDKHRLSSINYSQFSSKSIVLN